MTNTAPFAAKLPAEDIVAVNTDGSCRVIGVARTLEEASAKARARGYTSAVVWNDEAGDWEVGFHQDPD